MNSAFRALWLVNSEVISKYYSPLLRWIIVNCNHRQKQLRHSLKKDLFRLKLTREFFNHQFHISTPSPLFNVVTWKCPRSMFQHWQGGEGGLASNKLRNDADRKRLFFLNVSTHFCPWLQFPSIPTYVCKELKRSFWKQQQRRRLYLPPDLNLQYKE